MTLDVEIEEQQSWPPQFLEQALQKRSLIAAYQEERSRIERLGREEVAARVNRPWNRYEPEYRELVDRLEANLVRHRIVAYHCTRLTLQEVTGVKAQGLRVLSTTLVHSRLERCFRDGYLDQKQYEYLKDSERVRSNLSNRNGSRTGLIWFCANRFTLQDHLAVYRLFRSWGGEAIYCGHENDERIAGVISRIGTPCIVKCAIPFYRAEHFHRNFAERFLSYLVRHEVEYPDPPANFDLNTRQDVPPSDVLEIIEFSDPRFAGLTQCTKWDVHYQPDA